MMEGCLLNEQLLDLHEPFQDDLGSITNNSSEPDVLIDCLAGLGLGGDSLAGGSSSISSPAFSLGGDDGGFNSAKLLQQAHNQLLEGAGFHHPQLQGRAITGQQNGYSEPRQVQYPNNGSSSSSYPGHWNTPAPPPAQWQHSPSALNPWAMPTRQASSMAALPTGNGSFPSPLPKPASYSGSSGYSSGVEHSPLGFDESGRDVAQSFKDLLTPPRQPPPHFSTLESQLLDMMSGGKPAHKAPQPHLAAMWGAAPEMGGLDQLVPGYGPGSHLAPIPMPGMHGAVDHGGERFSRKVFVGGLPPDVDEEEIAAAFRRFGHLVVDWPHKQESKSYFPPKGYCFLLFQDEMSVQTLMEACIQDDGKMYWCVSSPTMKDKPVQIRPWNLGDSDFVMDGTQPLDPRKTIFVGGVPRPLRAVELALIMDRLYGGVCYAGIDTDPELKYPKGAGRVAFSNQHSYIAAISARFVQLQHAEIDKRVEVKPYVLDDQLCDECGGARCAGKFAPFFCANVTCLQYYCEACWAHIHGRPGREYHKPLVKEGADRPRSVPFRWC